MGVEERTWHTLFVLATEHLTVTVTGHNGQLVDLLANVLVSSPTSILIRTLSLFVSLWFTQWC